VPFIPNISKLAAQLETSRNHILEYLHVLEKAKLIYNLHSSTSGVSLLNKPEKIYLRNSNLMHVLAQEKPNEGSLRECFFLNQVSNAGHALTYSKNGDFVVDNHITFEIGGKEKDFSQVKNIENAYVAADNLEFGFGKKIPLWMFGFLY
jgi:predicted AAA+ superfamily ATPase